MLHGYNEIFLDVDRLRIIAQKLARGSERSYPLRK